MRKLVSIVVIIVFFTWMTPASAASERDVLSLIRQDRGDAIPTSPLLMRIAERRAHDIVSDYSHHGAGVPGVKLWGEILAWNSYPENLTEAEAVSQWMASDGHRAILLGRWTHVGVGVVDVGHRHFYAVVFAVLAPARPAPSLPPTDTD